MDILEKRRKQGSMRNFLTQKRAQYAGGQISELRKFIKSSGVYALASVINPLISLMLAPFLTHSLSTRDYGVFTLLNTIIGLTTGITQLGIGSAFFRAYNFDYTERNERQSVVATATFLLFIISTLMATGAIITAPFFAYHLLGHTSLSRLIAIAGVIVFLQNLAVPSFAWLRAESCALFYSLLSIGNILTTLLANIVLVGLLHWGIEGALIATGIGYIGVVFCTLSIIIFRVGIKIRIDIARNLLGFGWPLVFSFVSYWVLQLSDRYLLSRLSSLEETAKYAIAYTLGTAISVVILGPFTLAWPTTMFTIARGKDAPYMFQKVFRWLSLFLLLAALSLSFCGVLMLNWFFPAAYHSVAFVIPIVSASMVFYGIYYIFMIGANIKRKTWTSSIFTTLAAIVNLLMNLALIPRYGAMGAALSTLVAYIVLASSAYIVNQKLYPIAFEIERFVLAFLAGVVLYVGGSFLAQKQEVSMTLGIYVGAIVLYACILTASEMFPLRSYLSRHKKSSEAGISCISMPLHSQGSTTKTAITEYTTKKVCMHVRGAVRTDERVMREAISLKGSGFAVTILDIEDDVTRPVEEEIRGIHVKHVMRPGWLKPACFKPLRLILSMEKLIYTTVKLIQTPAEVYHAHDDNALAPCYIAALWHKTPLIFDAHEFPLKDVTHRRWLNLLLTHLLTLMMRRCSGIITVSPPIAQEIGKLYHVSNVSLVRNIAIYQKPLKSNRLRQFLSLGSDVQIALYQGNLQDDRSLDTLVRAGTFLEKNIVIVLIGKGVGSTQARLEALIASEGVGDRVKIIPPIPYAELLEWTASADIGLITFSPNYSTSIRLCLPNKLFEYIMAGLPVLASPLDAVEDVLRKYDVGLVVSSLSPVDIGTAIEAMLADRTGLERMRSNALAAAQKELCWERERSQLIRLYQNILMSWKTQKVCE